MRRFLRMTLLLGYILVICTLLSGKIEDTMAVRVTTKTFDLFLQPALPVSTLFWDDSGCHLYYLEETDAGPVVREMDETDYNINYEESSIVLSGVGECSVILSASRQPVAGEKAEVLKKRGQAQDRYLLTGQVWDSPEEAPQTQVQIVEKDRAQTPFLAHEAKQSLGLEFPEDWELYSLQDAEAFVKSLPKIAFMLSLFFLPVVLLAGSCIMESRKALWCNTGLSAAAVLGGWGLCAGLSLPVSWLPPDNIFRLSHYRGQMNAVLQALEQLHDTKIQTAWEQACRNATWILLGVGIFSLAILLAEVLFLRKKK